MQNANKKSSIILAYLEFTTKSVVQVKERKRKIVAHHLLVWVTALIIMSIATTNISFTEPFVFTLL